MGLERDMIAADDGGPVEMKEDQARGQVYLGVIGGLTRKVPHP